MDGWKKHFIDKLGKAQQSCAQRFEDALDEAFNPVFEDLSAFLRDNGFKVTQPLRENGRRSFKFELAENAYLLVLVRFGGLGDFELRSEAFVPGNKPVLRKFVGGLKDLSTPWAEKQFRTALDQFIELLSGTSTPQQSVDESADELAMV